MQSVQRMRKPGAQRALFAVIMAIITATVLAALSPFALGGATVSHASPMQAGKAKTASGAPLTGLSNAYADGGSLFVSASSAASLSVGPLFPASLGCTLKSGSATSTAAALDFNTGGQGGAVTDQVTNAVSTSRVTVTASATLHTLTLLNGHITSGTITAKTQSSATTTSATSQNLTTFASLLIAGQPVATSPNQRVSLPGGIGYVIVNEQSGYTTATTTRLSVNALHVYLTQATSGLPAGAQIIVGHAQSQFTRTIAPGLVGASSYGLYARGNASSPSAISGPYAWEIISCAGGHGAVTLASASLANALTLGAISDVATGQIATSGATAQATSTIQTTRLGTTDVALLGVDSITASATASFTTAAGAQVRGAVTLTDGSLLSGVLPSVLPTHPAPNTRVALPLLGYVLLNDQSPVVNAPKASIRVIAIAIFVTVPNNLLGLPVGSEIYLGVASASAAISG